VVCDVGRGRRGKTVRVNDGNVRVNDGKPGDELQVDFGRLGLLPDPEAARQRVCQGLIFTPVVSRYTFVWCSFPPDHRRCHRRLRGRVGRSTTVCSAR
jgi:hypothetical protein